MSEDRTFSAEDVIRLWEHHLTSAEQQRVYCFFYNTWRLRKVSQLLALVYNVALNVMDIFNVRGEPGLLERLQLVESIVRQIIGILRVLGALEDLECPVKPNPAPGSIDDLNAKALRSMVLEMIQGKEK